jgi:hypothetical protein
MQLEHVSQHGDDDTQYDIKLNIAPSKKLFLSPVGGSSSSSSSSYSSTTTTNFVRTASSEQALCEMLIDHSFNRDVLLLGNDGKSSIVWQFAHLLRYDVELLQLHPGFF